MWTPGCVTVTTSDEVYLLIHIVTQRPCNHPSLFHGDDDDEGSLHTHTPKHICAVIVETQQEPRHAAEFIMNHLKHRGKVTSMRERPPVPLTVVHPRPHRPSTQRNVSPAALREPACTSAALSRNAARDNGSPRRS